MNSVCFRVSTLNVIPLQQNFQIEEYSSGEKKELRIQLLHYSLHDVCVWIWRAWILNRARILLLLMLPNVVLFVLNPYIVCFMRCHKPTAVF